MKHRLKHRYGRASGAYNHAVNELLLYAENTGELYPQKQSVLSTVRSRVSRGAKANSEILWRGWLSVAARRYQREIGPMHFSKATIHEAAKELAEKFPRGEE